jgi:hypothetical protein
MEANVTLLPALMLSLLLAPPQAPEPVGRAVAADLAAGRFAAVAARFSPQMAAALPEARLRDVWTGLEAQAGALEGTGPARVSSTGGIDVVTVLMKFARMPLDMKVSIDADGRVAGLFFVPAEAPPAPWSAPAYANPEAYREVEVTVGKDPWALPGTLTLPTGRAKVPAVVLVHGSGPQDRNETIGPNRPFQDLAWGLASRGVAVLRYEKRTKAHADRLVTLKALTVREETMDDARAAVALLRARPEIDPTRIVLVGHSLGGTLAPRIAKEEPGLSGIVILAGATRPIADLIVEQSEYIASLGGPLDEAAKKRLADLKADAARARTAKPGDAPVLNAPAAYWVDLNAYDPAAVAGRLKLRMLVLQGGRDYQVTSKDLDGWKKALAGRPGVTIREFADLNHLFVTGEGKSTPAEYEKGGHVDVRVVEAIAAFAGGAPLP